MLPWNDISTKEDMVHEFTVHFADDTVIVGGKPFPLGRFGVEILNTPDEVLLDLCKKSDDFLALLEKIFSQATKIPALASELQESLNRIFDVLFTLPLFRELDLDRAFTKEFLKRAEVDDIQKMLTIGTKESGLFFEMIKRITDTGRPLCNFKSYVNLIADDYFEPVEKRNPSEYTKAISKFNRDSEKLNGIGDNILFGFCQFAEVLLEYVPYENQGEFTLAERMVITQIGDFLRAEFFRAIKQGNAPRRCHNCGKYFLLTSGHNICYCNNIAPDQTEFTCRRIGTHRKRSRHIGQTPIQTEYSITYNRLKTRKFRGKISTAEWNIAVAKAQEIKDAVERGQMDEFEGMRELQSF